MSSYIRQAFEQLCQSRTEADCCYVCLMESVPYYGGPEEGGWWGSDEIVVEYQYFVSKEIAEQVVERITKLAEELSHLAQCDYGEHCLATMAWLDERGLDADFLPEPDGPSSFYVTVSETIPENSYGSRGYS